MNSTFLARLTPAGSGAIATLALRGPSAWALVRELAHRELPTDPEPGRFWLTLLGGKAKGEADQVVVAVKSIEPEPWVEVHCHGGHEVVRFLEEQLSARGVVICPWQQLLQSSDPVRDAALEVLTRAPTTRTAAIALDQFNGALTRALESIRASLSNNDAPGAEKMLADLERFAPVGLHLTNPWRVVIAGAPNVGKSSLVNALAGYQRSIVSPEPGTTRDLVTTLLALDGWPVEVCDTAGWHEAQSELEREGIARAQQAATAADLCLWLVDASTLPTWPETITGSFRMVVNKVDLPPAWSLESVDALHVSAATGTGIADLCHAIASWLVPEIPPPGAAVPFTSSLAETISEVLSLTKSRRLQEALARLESLHYLRPEGARS